MMHLKMASAGSGKTYQLAKMFIKLLLTVKDPDIKRRLRTEENLEEALSSIMAVTFTVKATAEMKERIIERLADLTRAADITDDQIGSIPYLKEFMEDLGLERSEIARMANAALRTLLLRFSDFRVQTIDSFFQSLLHTFAYEASLEDNFNMELDSGYMASIGFDSVLDSVSQDSYKPGTKDEGILYWLKEMMDDKSGSNKWNVFARKETRGHLYKTLIDAATNLEKEDFKEKKEALDEYFASLKKPLKDVVNEIDVKVAGPLKELYEKKKIAAEKVLDELNALGLVPADLANSSGKALEYSLLPLDINKIKKYAFKDVNDEKYSSLKGTAKTQFRRSYTNKEEADRLIGPLDSAYRDWAELHNEFYQWLADNKRMMNTWAHYKTMIPQLMVVLGIYDKKREYLQLNNTLQISDTAMLLSRIIGDDDTSFIYERMGSRLNHYLIDEFQDTSRMQWNILKPLVGESESNGHDNLIIGDAKQSIYRFRNADYRLILSVKDDFGEVVPYTTEKDPGKSKLETTNFRSRPRIVEFNNFLFPNLVKYESDGQPVFDESAQEIYENCRQNFIDAGEKNGVPLAEGFVDIKFYPKELEKSGDDTESWEEISIEAPGFKELPERIMNLKKRGYAFKDITVLVKSHKQGAAALKAIGRHNTDCPNEQIPVISEENLLVAGALSIKIIIHALEIIAGGKIKDDKKIKPEWNEPVEEKVLYDSIKNLPTMSLPSIIETIAEKCVPAELRNNDAPFLAAFQDAVLDYSSRQASDVGTFLKWWQRKSKSLSISSPEESDGVRIQTVHKAKGLENKCVIVPMASFSFQPSQSHSEWRWVKPHPDIPDSNLLPPYLPVVTSNKLSDTLHANVRENYCREHALDELNAMYVAFTRPRVELYIYVPIYQKNNGKTLSSFFSKILNWNKEEEAASEEASLEFTFEESENGIKEVTYGKIAESVQIEADRDEADKKDTQMLDRYAIYTERGVMQFENGKKHLLTHIHAGGLDDELDPRAEGTLKHRLMQQIETPEDLDKALRRMKVYGLVSVGQVEEWGRELKEAISKVKKYGWFEPGMRVVNERKILNSVSTHSRPDRIVVDDEGNATVIDYKFGEKEESTHHKQVKDYMKNLCMTEKFQSVEGYLWYISEDRIVKVEPA